MNRMQSLFVGLLLDGFEVLIIAYPEFFAIVTAVFFIAGGSLILTTLRIYIASYKFKRIWSHF